MLRRLEQRLRRLEQQHAARRTPLEITDEVRAAAAVELAAWRATQEAAIAAERARTAKDGNQWQP